MLYTMAVSLPALCLLALVTHDARGGSVHGKKTTEGFTLMELLVVVAFTATLAALLLPTWAKARQQAQSVQCLGNFRQIMLGWRMYAVDNNDILAPNDYPYMTAYATQSAAVKRTLRNWVCGTMEQAVDSTNLSELTDPIGTALSHYLSNPYVYNCPADNYIDTRSHKMHVRSVSMNSAVGTTWYSFYVYGTPALGAPVQADWLGGASFTPNIYLTYGKMSSFTKPGPANTWVIMDENPYSINDASFAASAFATTGNTYLIDFPSGNHNNGASMAFVDGHAIIHTWLDLRTRTPVGVPGMGGTASTKQTPDNPDCFYLAPLTSTPR